MDRSRTNSSSTPDFAAWRVIAGTIGRALEYEGAMQRNAGTRRHRTNKIALSGSGALADASASPHRM